MSLILNGTTGVSGVDGSAGTPALQGNDSNTGISFGTDTVTINTGGVARVTTDASGNLGLGVTPSAWNSAWKALQIGSRSAITSGAGTVTDVNYNFYRDVSNNDVYIANDFATRYRQISGGHYWSTAPSGTAGATVAFGDAKMSLDASGNLLVGVTSTVGNERLNVTKDVANNIARFINTNASPYGILLQYGSGVDPNNTGNDFIECRANLSTPRLLVRSNGGIANYSSNNVNLSDRREKTNFAPAKNYLDIICAIPVQTFNYIDQNTEEDDGLTLGVVAQDVQAVAPELVMESNWGTKDEPKMRLSIYQTDLQYALMKCIQEQQTLIQSLTSRLEALENK